MYKNPEDVLFKWVATVGYFKEFRFKPVQFSADFMGTFPKFTKHKAQKGNGFSLVSYP